MSKNLSAKIGTVALVGHGAAGKTTLAESLLAATGAITSRGWVDKRGHVTGTQPRLSGNVAISGQIPLVELDDYQGRLKSLTGGQGSYNITFSHYAPVPGDTQRELASKYKAVNLGDE
ncbi:MAG TPA: hypothetical protein VIK56_10485 [Rhodoferax sp.]